MMIPGSVLHGIFPSIVWKGTSSSIHLTYDDGPHPSVTPGILQILQSYDVKATFFLLGKNAKTHPELVRQILAEGHSVANHSFDHPLMLFRSSSFIERQIHETSDVLADIAHHQTTLFRPPYGYFGPKLLRIAKRRNHQVVLWNIDPLDWKRDSSKEVVDVLCRLATQGSIVLLHDNARTASIAFDVLKHALDRLLPSFSFSPLHT